MSKIALSKKPEEEELATKRAELERLQGELAERELELSNLQAELAAFEARYLMRVGILYAELDELNSVLAIDAATSCPSEAARIAAEEANNRARRSRTVADSVRTSSTYFRASEELKLLYRQVAKRVHPDLAANEADRRNRESLMAEANEAYRAADDAHLRRILERYNSDPDVVIGDGVGAELVRTIRKISQVKRRLADIANEILVVSSSEICKLRQCALEMEQEGRDLLAEMAGSIRAEIDATKNKMSARRSAARG